MIIGPPSPDQDPQPAKPEVEFWRNPRWWRIWAFESFSPMFHVFLVLAVVSGALVWWLKGEEVFFEALAADVQMVLYTVPRVMAAIGVAATLWVLIPREKISALIGRNSGFLGLMLATVGGAITPGGPTSAFSLLAMLGALGADRGMMITYISAWATLGLQRILVWDVPMMGMDFSLLRFVATLPLPILAGLLARSLPITLTLKEERRLRDRL